MRNSVQKFYTNTEIPSAQVDILRNDYTFLSSHCYYVDIYIAVPFEGTYKSCFIVTVKGYFRM